MNVKGYNCQLCDSKIFTKIADYTFKNKIFKNKIIVECKKCSFKSVHPIPDEKLLEEYNKNYFLNAHNDLKLNTLEETYFNCIAKCRINFLESSIKKNLDFKNVLEIGPGKGHFYENFKKNNKNVKYSVLETDLGAQKILEKKNIKVYDKYEDLSENYFDLIIFSHVLEHVGDPNLFLKRIHKFLKKDGIIFLEIPCLDYIYKDLIEPHIFFYDKNSLSSLLSKNNFENQAISYFGKKIEQMKKKPLHKQFKFRFLYFLLKLNFIFFVNLKEDEKYNFLNSKYEKILANMYQMNDLNNEPSWWIRAVATKN